MKLETLLDLCKKQDWPALIDFLSSDIKESYAKILVSAVVKTYNKDPDMVEKHGLNGWDKVISGEPVTQGLAMMTGAVDLNDLATAYLFAVGTNGLNDKKVANVIAEFIKANKIQLATYLDSDKIPEENKKLIEGMLSDLRVSKPEREAYYKQKFSEKTKERILFLQSIDKVKDKFAKIFDLKDSEFHLTYSESSSMRGIQSDSIEGNISFRENVSRETLQKIADTLKDLEIGAHFFDMSLYTGRKNAKGIQLFGHPVEMDKKLSQFQSFLRNEKTNPSDEAIYLQKQGFFKVIEDIRELQTIKSQAPSIKLK